MAIEIDERTAAALRDQQAEIASLREEVRLLTKSQAAETVEALSGDLMAAEQEIATLTAARDRWAAEAVRLKAEAAEARRKGIEEAARVAGRVGSPVVASDGCTRVVGTSEDAVRAIRALLAEENGDG